MSNTNSRKRPLKILFVCHADSTHAQGWMSFLANTDFEVRVFTTYPNCNTIYGPTNWQFPTYTPVRLYQNRRAPQLFHLLPFKLPFPIFVRLDQKLKLSERWLRRIILDWQPDILHTLRLGLEGTLCWNVLQSIPAIRRPVWLVNAWGSDVSWRINLPKDREMVIAILRDCDGFSADCQNVLDIAVANGLDSHKIMTGAPIPGPGGLDLQVFSQRREILPPAQRKIILIPKAVEGNAQQAFTLLEGLRLALDDLKSAHIHLLMCSSDVEHFIYNLPNALRERCIWTKFLPQKKFFDLLFRSRIMMAPTLSDGTPNVMLEAMAAGALPIMAPLPSIKEWIQDGRNGLLAGALYPEQIAQAIRRAMSDNNLCKQASRLNWELVKKRANRAHFQTLVLKEYHNLVNRKHKGIDAN